MPGTAYNFPIFPDGQATYPTEDGGWILVTNSESLATTEAGTSAIRFGPDGSIEDAYFILRGTNANCAGGPTPWGTWLSCEEFDRGQVWECDPAGRLLFQARPALGIFNHEAVAVDPVGRKLYLTEDEGDGAFYRFRPTSYPSLDEGKLDVAVVDGGAVTWTELPDPAAMGTPTRDQVEKTDFRGGEASGTRAASCTSRPRATSASGRTRPRPSASRSSTSTTPMPCPSLRSTPSTT